MTDEVVLEGNGTHDEMEARLIAELKRRNWLTAHTIQLLEIEQEPPKDAPGRYRVRIKSPNQ